MYIQCWLWTCIIWFLYPHFKIIWQRLYKTTSSKDGGTLLQIKNLINRRNIGKDISGRVNEVEDFLELVISCHLIAAALHFFSMESVTDTPHSNGFSAHVNQMSLPERTKIFRLRMEKIINDYVISREFSAAISAPTGSAVNPHASRIQHEHGFTSAPTPIRQFPHSISNVFHRQHASETIWTAAPDGIFNYASAVLNDGLLLLEFKDAIHEGDGPRIVRCWKVLLMYFHYAKHKNYRLEAFHLLADVGAAASERIAHQLTWCRTINTCGGKGQNIPLDLHMEHLNRVVKDHVSNLGQTLQKSQYYSVARASRG